MSTHDLDVGHAKHTLQLADGNSHRPRVQSSSRCGLRKRCSHCREILIRLDNQAALNRALDHLHPQLREVLLQCDVEELKYKDIALVLNVPIGTVMSRISRTRRTLHQQLKVQFGESL
jgi:RNA polymerase sigma factor (sigma-70 family)